MNGKRIRDSWTIRFGLAIEVLTEIAGLTWVSDNATAVIWIGRAIAVLTIALRFKTGEPLRLHKAANDLPGPKTDE